MVATTRVSGTTMCAKVSFARSMMLEMRATISDNSMKTRRMITDENIRSQKIRFMKERFRSIRRTVTGFCTCRMARCVALIIGMMPFKGSRSSPKPLLEPNIKKLLTILCKKMSFMSWRQLKRKGK